MYSGFLQQFLCFIRYCVQRKFTELLHFDVDTVSKSPNPRSTAVVISLTGFDMGYVALSDLYTDMFLWNF